MSVAIVFDLDWKEDGPGEAFQLIIESMERLLVEVTPADGGPAFTAQLAGGREDGDAELDQVRIYRVDVDLEPIGEPEYVRVKALRISS